MSAHFVHVHFRHSSHWIIWSSSLNIFAQLSHGVSSFVAASPFSSTNRPELFSLPRLPLPLPLPPRVILRSLPVGLLQKILTRLNYLLGWTVFPLTRLVEAWRRGAITTCLLVYKVHMGQTAFEWEAEVIRLSISFPRATPGEDTVCRGQERVVLVLVERTVYQITTPAGPARLNMAAVGRPKRRETDSTKKKSKVILSLRPSPQFSSILRKYP